MKEDLLHFIWQFGKFNTKHLSTTTGEKIVIQKVGMLNRNAGPDFLNARITIGDTEWVGNVELHINASDWFKHRHSYDDNYKNVILHVVFNHDVNGFHLPTLELKERISNVLLNRYDQVMRQRSFVPCEYFLPALDDFTWLAWKERLITERLESKTERILNSLKRNKNDWQQTFYEQLGYNFGLKTNELAFEELTQRLPLKIIAKHRQNLLQIEALLFGVAGLLDAEKDDYSQQLASEFSFLQKKYTLNPMRPTNWNFGGVRPPSLPTVRIAQFASLLANSSALFSKVLEASTEKELSDFFKVWTSDYWKTHYVFGKESDPKIKTIGKDKTQNIIINTIVPFQFLYGKQLDKPKLMVNSIELLRKVDSEKNSIITKWNANDVKCSSAFDSQALLHLHKNYCENKQCLNCRVGHSVFHNVEL